MKLYAQLVSLWPKFYSLCLLISRKPLLLQTLPLHWKMKELVPSVLTLLEMGKAVVLQDLKFF